MVAVVESAIGLAPDSTGKKVDNTEVVTSAGTVERQVTVTGDPSDPNARTNVSQNDPDRLAYGTVVRVVGEVNIADIKTTNELLLRILLKLEELGLK